MQAEAVREYIISWLKDYAAGANAEGFIVGVSGGIDSALVSVLAAQTGLKTALLVMPIRQKEDQTLRAEKHIAGLMARYPNVETYRTDLTPVFDAFVCQTAADKSDSTRTGLALANARSRLRMTCLYYYGQQLGLLVAGTGNKVEDFGVGFFTKYGDGGVDISPIAGLLKTQVYTLAAATGLVAEDILQAAPTDGLWDEDKTDEQQIGATYPELEWAMSVYDGHTAQDFGGRERTVFEIYNRLHRAMRHKVEPIPVCTVPEALLA